MDRLYDSLPQSSLRLDCFRIIKVLSERSMFTFSFLFWSIYLSTLILRLIMVRLKGIYNHSWGLSIMSEMMLCAKIQLIIYLGYGGVSVSIFFSHVCTVDLVLLQKSRKIQ